MRLFFKAFLLAVVLPSVILIPLIVFLAHRMGFMLQPLAIARMQQDEPRILWMGHGGYYGPYHLERIKASQPDIIFLGHSRCVQLRSMMFKPYRFHNSCLTAWTFAQIRTMADLATRHGGPKVVMFTMDYFMFSEAYAKQWAERASMQYEAQYFQGLRDFVTSLKGYPVELLTAMPAYFFGRARSRVDGLERLGIGAVRSHAGFRSDGSVLYDAKTRDAAPNNNRELSRILGTVPAGAGRTLAPAQLEELKKLGDLGRERNLTIVGIQLPLIKQATDILDSGKDYTPYLAADAGLWRDLQSEAFRTMFRDMGIHFFDWSRDPVGEDSRTFIDPAHPSEYANLATIVRAARSAEFRAILPDLDVQALERQLAEAQKTGDFFDVFRYRF